MTSSSVLSSEMNDRKPCPALSKQVIIDGSGQIITIYGIAII